MLKEIIKLLSPQAFIIIIRDFYGFFLDGYSQKSYSQEGEDMILQRIFGKQETGFYIDVGAHHPRRFSNTYLFYKKGWRGINIDAMPNSMKRFNRSRPRDINIEKPISEKKQILTYYIFNEPALNGFSKELSEKRNGENGYFVEFTHDIETCTLEEVLDKNLPENQEIDFLSIDVEGLDFEVLKSNNFEKHRPKIILIEILNSSLNSIQESKVSNFLETVDYHVYAKAMNTVIFIEKFFLKELQI
jgi:FkbM family methyltransferase